MKTFGLAALILVLAGSSFVLAQEVPNPAPAVEASGQPPAIQPPLTPAEKSMRRFHRYDAGRSGPVEIFSPVPRVRRNSPPWAIPSGGAAVMAPSPMMQGEIAGHPQVPPMPDGINIDQDAARPGENGKPIKYESPSGASRGSHEKGKPEPRVVDAPLKFGY